MKKFLVPTIIMGMAFTLFGFINQTKSTLPKINKNFLIHVHAFAGSDSTLKGLGTAELESHILAVNEAFAKIGVSFTICKTDTIYNKRYQKLDLTFDETADLMKEMNLLYGVEDRINLYIVDTLGPIASGIASLEGINHLKQNTIGAIFIKQRADDRTYIHEMGHFFGLPHTFERDNGLELADGSNCETAGDGICDTPADPYEVDEPMSKWIDSSECRFIYKGKDANGDYYSPDLANYMSYYGSPCSSCARFTDGQYKAMVDNYNSGKIAW